MDDEIIIYKSEDGVVRVDVLFADETVWLTQEQMSDLFGKAKSTISIFRMSMPRESCCRIAQ